VPLLVDPSSNEVGSALATVRGVTDAVAVERAATQFVAGQLDGDVGEAEEAVADAAADLAPVQALELDESTRRERSPSAFAYPAPANMVLFVFINTFAVSTTLANDRKNGILQRILSTPHRSGTVLLGIGAARAAFALAQSLLILVIGSLVFGVSWGDPLAVAALVVTWAILSTSVGVLLGSIVGSAEQAQAVGIPVAVAMGMLGGCMWPLGIVPDALRVVGHLTPHAWAMDAWAEQVFSSDPSFTDAGRSLLVLAGFIVVIGALAARSLRRVVVR
jgi:ABC-2 type transport system permease protein